MMPAPTTTTLSPRSTLALRVLRMTQPRGSVRQISSKAVLLAACRAGSRPAGCTRPGPRVRERRLAEGLAGVIADAVQPAAARFTVAAAGQRRGHHAITDLGVSIDLLAQLDQLAGYLVPARQRVEGLLAAVEALLPGADGARLHLDQGLPWPRFRDGHSSSRTSLGPTKTARLYVSVTVAPCCRPLTAWRLHQALHSGVHGGALMHDGDDGRRDLVWAAYW